MELPLQPPAPHTPEESKHCTNPKFFEIFGSPCDNIKDFLLDDAKNNYLANMMNAEQQRNEFRFKRLMKDIEQSEDETNF